MNLKRFIESAIEGTLTQKEIDEKTDLLHGSRHWIADGKFNLERIKSGEGNLAFGWGLYLAENPGVANFYRSAGFKNPTNAEGLKMPSGETFVWNAKKLDWLLRDGTSIWAWGEANGYKGLGQAADRWASYVNKFWRSFTHHDPQQLENQYFSYLRLEIKDVEEKVAALTKEIAALTKKRDQMQARLNSRIHGPKTQDSRDLMIDAVNDAQEDIDLRQERLDSRTEYLEGLNFLNSASPFSVNRPWPNKPLGNLYKIVGPDKDDLLWWDGEIRQQPKLMSLFDEINFILQKRAINDLLLETRRLIGEQAIPIAKALLFKYKTTFVLNQQQFENEPEVRQLAAMQKRDQKYTAELLKKIYDWITRKQPYTGTTSKQPAKALTKLNPTHHGSDLYWALTQALKTDKNASMWLKDHGISALYYFDAFSRAPGVPRPTYNWVVFDESIVKIQSVSGEHNQSW